MYTYNINTHAYIHVYIRAYTYIFLVYINVYICYISKDEINVPITLSVFRDKKVIYILFT